MSGLYGITIVIGIFLALHSRGLFDDKETRQEKKTSLTWAYVKAPFYLSTGCGLIIYGLSGLASMEPEPTWLRSSLNDNKTSAKFPTPPFHALRLTEWGKADSLRSEHKGSDFVLVSFKLPIEVAELDLSRKITLTCKMAFAVGTDPSVPYRVVQENPCSTDGVNGHDIKLVSSQMKSIRIQVFFQKDRARLIGIKSGGEVIESSEADRFFESLYLE